MKKTLLSVMLVASAAVVGAQGPPAGRALTIEDYSHVQTERSREIAAWTEVLPLAAQKVATVYGYANNHFEGHSPHTLRELHRALGLPVRGREALVDQLELL